jgi:hypothetical protein
VIGANELLENITEKYFENRDGNLLVAFGELFTRNIRIYLYPALNPGKPGELLTSETLPIPDGIEFLFKYLLESQHIVDVTTYNAELLHVLPQSVLHMIQTQSAGWEKYLPAELVDEIKDTGMYGWKSGIPV